MSQTNTIIGIALILPAIIATLLSIFVARLRRNIGLSLIQLASLCLFIGWTIGFTSVALAQQPPEPATPQELQDALRALNALEAPEPAPVVAAPEIEYEPPQSLLNLSGNEELEPGDSDAPLSDSIIEAEPPIPTPEPTPQNTETLDLPQNIEEEEFRIDVGEPIAPPQRLNAPETPQNEAQPPADPLLTPAPATPTPIPVPEAPATPTPIPAPEAAAPIRDNPPGTITGLPLSANPQVLIAEDTAVAALASSLVEILADIHYAGQSDALMTLINASLDEERASRFALVFAQLGTAQSPDAISPIALSLQQQITTLQSQLEEQDEPDNTAPEPAPVVAAPPVTPIDVEIIPITSELEEPDGTTEKAIIMVNGRREVLWPGDSINDPNGEPITLLDVELESPDENPVHRVVIEHLGRTIRLPWTWESQ